MDHKEGWETKNWCFWIVVLRVSWRVPRRSKQSVLKEINTEYSLEGPMLKLKLQYFGYQLRRANSLEKTLMLGKIEGKRRRGRQRIRWLNSIINSMGLTLVAKSLIRLRDWATTAWMKTGKPNCWTTKGYRLELKRPWLLPPSHPIWKQECFKKAATVTRGAKFIIRDTAQVGQHTKKHVVFKTGARQRITAREHLCEHHS